MRQRTRDLGFGHHHDILIVIVIIGILAAIAIPNLLKILDKQRVTCLRNLLAQADGTLPKETLCPVAKKPYPAGDVLSCPDPAKHLESKPRIVRPKEGAWRLEQALPAYSGGSIEIKSSRVEVQTHPGRTAVLVKPGRLARFFLGPVMFLVSAIASLAFAGRIVWAVWKKKWDEIVGPVIGAAIMGPVAYFSMMAFATSHEWVVERSGARVTRVEYLFGSRRSEKTVERCAAVVPVKTTSGHRLHLVHPPAADGSRLTSMELIDEDRLDLADWFNRALAGP